MPPGGGLAPTYDSYNVRRRWTQIPLEIELLVKFVRIKGVVGCPRREGLNRNMIFEFELDSEAVGVEGGSYGSCLRL